MVSSGYRGICRATSEYVIGDPRYVAGTERTGLLFTAVELWPPFLLPEDLDNPNTAFITGGLDEGVFVEFRDGPEGDSRIHGLFVVVKCAPKTSKGRWVEGILLGCNDPDWRAWYDNHGPADGTQGDATGFFHLCSRIRCTARSGRSDVPEVHMEEFRILSRALVRDLEYAREGLAAYDHILDGAELGSSDGELQAMAALNRPEKRLKKKSEAVPMLPDPASRPARGREPLLGADVGHDDTRIDFGAGTGLGAALANADVQAAADARAAGVQVGVGLGKLGSLPKAPITLAAGLAPPARLVPPDIPVGGLERASTPSPLGSPREDVVPKSLGPQPQPSSSAGGGHTLIAGILESAAKLRAKRQSASAEGPASKKAKAVAALVGLLSGEGLASGSSDPLDPSQNSLNSAEDHAENADFLGAPETGSAEPLSLVSKRQPGKLFALGLGRVRERLAALQGGRASDATDAMMAGRALCFYHAVICRPMHPQMALHTAREMETLADIVDSLCAGDLERLGDVAIQRYQALEKACVDNSWELAQELEVVDRQEKHLASEELVHRASRRRLQDVRLQNALQNLRNRSGRLDGAAPSGSGAGPGPG